MLTEINEQPQILRRLAESRDNLAMAETTEAIKDAIKAQSEVVLVGNGSSYHSCIYGQYLFSIKNNLLVNTYDTSEFADFIPNLSQKSVVIIVSQSGETGDALEIIPKIKNQKSKIVSITNNPKSTLAKESDIMIDLMLGETNAIPNTKGYTAAMAVFALLSDKIKATDHFAGQIENIASEIEKIISIEHDDIKLLADRLHRSELMFVLGHSIGLANAYETALKIKECCHIPAEGYSGPEFRHGPSSLVEKNTPVIVFVSDIDSEEELHQVITEIKHNSAFVIGISAENSFNYDKHFSIMDDYLYSPIISIVPAQLLAYELAMAKGLNPDKPEGVRQFVK